MKTVIKKFAGTVLDIQDDPGTVWKNKIENFWPSELDKPTLGKRAKQEDCLVNINGNWHFPVDSPENTLASSMYFFTNAQLFDKTAMVKIATDLKSWREAWDVKVPSGFMESLSDEKVEIKKDAQEFPRFKKNASKNAPGSIVLRMRVMKPLEDIDGHDEYMNKMASLYIRLKDKNEDFEKLAEELREADMNVGMDSGWDDYFPNPYDSVFTGVDFSVLPNLPEKKIDWSGLNSVFSSDVVKQIARNPDEVIPTLPLQQRMIVEDYINDKGIRSK